MVKNGKAKVSVFIVALVFAPLLHSAQKEAIGFCGDEFPPYLMFDNSISPSPRGIAVDYINSIFKSLNMNVEFFEYPWARCELLLKKGVMDGTAIIRRSEDREQYLSFSESIFEKPIFLVHLKGRFQPSFKWIHRDELKIFNFASGRDFSITRDLLDSGFKVSVVKSQLQAYEMLLHGRIDFTTDFESSFEKLIETYPKFNGHLMLNEKPYRKAVYHIALSRSSSYAHLLPQINSVIDDLRKSGSLKSILKLNKNGGPTSD